MFNKDVTKSKNTKEVRKELLDVAISRHCKEVKNTVKKNIKQIENKPIEKMLKKMLNGVGLEKNMSKRIREQKNFGEMKISHEGFVKGVTTMLYDEMISNPQKIIDILESEKDKVLKEKLGDIFSYVDQVFSDTPHKNAMLISQNNEAAEKLWNSLFESNPKVESKESNSTEDESEKLTQGELAEIERASEILKQGSLQEKYEDAHQKL